MAIIQEPEPPLPKNEDREQTKRLFLAKSKNYIIGTIKSFLGHAEGFLMKNSDSRVFPVSLPIKPRLAAKFKYLYSGNILPHVVIVLLALVVVASNWKDKATAQALYDQLVYVDPASEHIIIQNVDVFTPLISDDGGQVQKVAVTAQNDGFISAIGSVETQITSREEPLPDNSSKTVAYNVRNGDTLSGIGMKFDVKIASIKYVNNLNDVNLIRPGNQIKIPPKGYEVSATAIAKQARDNQAKLAMSRSTLTRSTSTARAADTYASASAAASLRVPLSYSYISRGVGGGHTGIDYVAANGTQVYAAASGVVIQVSTGWSGGYGNEIVISHGGGIATRYAHLSRVRVSAGETVSAGELIGNVGNSGRAYGASGGYHLHFEELVNGHYIKPQF